MLTIAFPPLKGVGGMFYLKERSICTLGMLIIRYAKVIKKYQSAKKRDCPFWGQSITDVPIR